MKNDSWRQDLASYRLRFELPTRYADVDAERHVNNVAVQTLHAEARSRLHLSVFGWEAWQPLTATVRTRAVRTDFLQVTYYPAPVTCGAALVEVDASGYTLALGLFQQGRCVGVQSCRIGAWRDGEWRPLPAAVREAMLDFGPDAVMAAGLPGGAPGPGAGDDADGGGAEAGGYPCADRLTTRFGDLDADGMLSELALARYFEQGRSHLLLALGQDCGADLRHGPVGMLIASTGARVLRQVRPGAEMTLASGVVRIGRTSVVLRTAVFQGEACVGIADNVMVFIARADGRPTLVPAALARRLEGLACAGLPR
ncbi:hypothetical protein BKK79_32595 [Cupriavidus sp. USMAA2-4]|uniref:thioesterase family protein n=1 Tax=Cupriavidus sp. USMAA2-4 TaxID=876364 RepID=UPI0008A6AC72|nr:thioesterase family protein [Cupriavidus sp. USMAA2-4]AOY96334.1 hypothetical protein BKK79_32595 [Cupriavidus sp. USMAA2-4]